MNRLQLGGHRVVDCRRSRFFMFSTAALFTVSSVFADKKTQTISLDEIKDRTYGSPPLVVKGSADSGLPVSLFVNGPASINKAGQVTLKGTGKVTVFAIQQGDKAFQPAKPVIGSFMVKKAPLTIRAENKSKKEGEADPELTVKYEGFVNGEDAAVFAQPVKVEVVATGKGRRTKHRIVPSGAQASNYRINFVEGELKVRRKSFFRRN